jgi:hypothetical protein
MGNSQIAPSNSSIVETVTTLISETPTPSPPPSASPSPSPSPSIIPSPSPSPSPNPVPTSNPTTNPTVNPTNNPTVEPTSTNNPTSTIQPSPTVPEFPAIAVLIIIAVFSASLLLFRKKRFNIDTTEPCICNSSQKKKGSCVGKQSPKNAFKRNTTQFSCGKKLKATITLFTITYRFFSFNLTLTSSQAVASERALLIVMNKLMKGSEP